MPRYIDADAFKTFIEEHLPRSAPQASYDAYLDILQMLQDERATPTADVQEVKQHCISADKLLAFYDAEREKVDEIFRSSREISERELALNAMSVMDKFYFRIIQLMDEEEKK